jgi:hypothetical protein
VPRDLVESREWDEYNYLNSATQDWRYGDEWNAQTALAEALGRLRARGFIARTAGQMAPDAIFVTRGGPQSGGGGAALRTCAPSAPGESSP